ncbi:MAG: nucleoside monophosphate kinase, partial [Bacilli bacterium]|nr:nucleoside monophosphate kinase [Bacilli bacterium]
VINLKVDEDELLPRIEGRRMCRKCGASYHVKNNKPKKEGVCDICGGELYQRDDDNASSVKNRMNAYHKSTAPLIDYYSQKQLCKDIEAMGDIDEIFAEIVKVLEAM